jgi:hypothetical protein
MRLCPSCHLFAPGLLTFSALQSHWAGCLFAEKQSFDHTNTTRYFVTSKRASWAAATSWQPGTGSTDQVLRAGQQACTGERIRVLVIHHPCAAMQVDGNCREIGVRLWTMNTTFCCDKVVVAFFACNVNNLYACNAMLCYEMPFHLVSPQH